jgi:hypothetical protein
LKLKKKMLNEKNRRIVVFNNADSGTPGAIILSYV